MRFSGSVACTDSEEFPKPNKSVLHKQFQDCGKDLPPVNAAVYHSLPGVHLAS